MNNPPTGTVTFLFTDIVGSTRLWDEHPDAARQALARHDQLVEEIVVRHGGTVVRPRGEGDSRFAVFSLATGATAAAADLQVAMRQEPWPTPSPLKIRIALHTGEADYRDGDYYGRAVNRCARLRSAAHGEQILLSQITYELVLDSLPPGSAIEDLGEHRLRDLAKPERIFQLVPPGFSGDFPPLVALDARPNNLPMLRSTLVGREKLLEAISSVLMRDDVAVLTLTGPGGTGKTRLSLQIAAELLERFADGAFFVPLEPVNDATLVASTIARTFDIREDGGRPILEALEDYLRDKTMLLVLDNFEQVLAAGPVVSRLATAAPGLKVLTTSRSRLHIRGEHEMPVPPLTLPGLGMLAQDAQTISQYEAVQLFIERAVAVKPDFEINNDNAPAVAEICARLDGLPLAIELAAARIKLLPPRAMLSRLQHRLSLLVGGERDLPSRQQTLRGAIDWSYNLLTEQEQLLFRQLSIAVGGCTLQAAEAICACDGRIDVLDGLSSLLDKSLFQQEEQPDGEPRFSMLETIREYALERLSESGELDEISQNHAHFFLELAREAEPQLYRTHQLEWLDRLEMEHDNLRAALSFSTQQGDAETALEIAASLRHFWMVRGYLTEGRAWLEEACNLAASQGIESQEYARAMYGLAILCRSLSDLPCVAAYSAESAKVARRIGDEPSLGWALAMLAVAQVMTGEAEAAGAAMDESLVIAGKPGLQAWDRANILLRSGMLLNSRRQYDQARLNLQEALDLFRRTGDRWGMAQALNFMGDMARMQADYPRAEQLYLESLQYYREIGIKRDVPASLHNLGHVALATGDCDKAEKHFTEALLLHRELGNKHGIAECLAGLAGVAGIREESNRAARLFAASAALQKSGGGPQWAAEIADYERNVSIARAGLDAQAWQSAWAEGEAMDMEHAIAYALERTPAV